MTSDGNAVRQRDASRTTHALLAAAQELFGQQGYERTTLREIGELAGVDAALIARYFGNKASIYIAALEAEEHTDPNTTGHAGQGIAERVIDRATRLGPTPVLRSIVTPDHDPGIGRAARAVLARRTIGPLRARMTSSGLDHPDLRAEIAIAALAGIALARAAGTLELLSSAPTADVVDICEQILPDLA